MLIVIPLLFVACFRGVRIGEIMPDNAVVLADEQRQVYLAPPLLWDDNRKFLVATDVETARDLGARPAAVEIERMSEYCNVVLVDQGRGVWYVLPQPDFTMLTEMTVRQARNAGYEPDDRHRNWGGFIDDVGLIGFVLRKTGLSQTRWTADGDWRW